MVGASALELLLENQPRVLAQRVELDRRSGGRVRYPRCAGEWVDVRRTVQGVNLKPSLVDAIAKFGRDAKAKLNNPSAKGEPEDQLRGPFEQLVGDLAALCGFAPRAVVAVGETSLSSPHIRPDYAITVGGPLVGFVELKAPGKGADPRRMKGAHDKAQWQRLQSLPNLLYADGNEFSLWRNGVPVSAVGFVEPVSPSVWDYRVAGKQVLQQWFNNRKKVRDKPQIGDRREPSPLGDLQPESWPAEYTTELLNVINVLGLLVDLEPQAVDLLERICSGPLVTQAALQSAGVFFPEGHVPATVVAQQSFEM
jgi:hypothetical protein